MNFFIAQCFSTTLRNEEKSRSVQNKKPLYKSNFSSNILQNNQILNTCIVEIIDSEAGLGNNYLDRKDIACTFLGTKPTAPKINHLATIYSEISSIYQKKYLREKRKHITFQSHLDLPNLLVNMFIQIIFRIKLNNIYDLYDEKCVND